MKQPLYLVAGLGMTGRSIAGYLQRRNLPFVVFDTRKEVGGLEEFMQDFPGVEVFLSELPNSIYQELTEIITSPGVALENPVFQEAHRLQIPIIGDIECLAREITAPVVAITGTNGKSTVTTLVGEMAKAAGLTVALAGNIGLPVLDLLDNDEQYDLWVLELSSFQLDVIHSLKPIAATILNISPDHLDRHHHFRAYVEAKQRVYHQANVLIHNREDTYTYPLETSLNNLPAPILSFGLSPGEQDNWGIIHKEEGIFLAKGNNCFLNIDELHLKGKHNWQNALAACALATIAGIDIQPIISVLRTFSGLPHRCQWVRTLNGVDWINDSKGTNVGATISAVSGIGGAIQGKIILIAGGLGKGAEFSELKQSVNDYVRSVVLIGVDAELIAQALAGGPADLLRAKSLEEAILVAKGLAQPHDVVLLSPACASFDMFRDFNHRGESFANLVASL